MYLLTSSFKPFSSLNGLVQSYSKLSDRQKKLNINLLNLFPCYFLISIYLEANKEGTEPKHLVIT